MKETHRQVFAVLDKVGYRWTGLDRPGQMYQVEDQARAATGQLRWAKLITSYNVRSEDEKEWIGLNLDVLDRVDDFVIWLDRTRVVFIVPSDALRGILEDAQSFARSHDLALKIDEHGRWHVNLDVENGRVFPTGFGGKWFADINAYGRTFVV